MGVVGEVYLVTRRFPTSPPDSVVDPVPGIRDQNGDVEEGTRVGRGFPSLPRDPPLLCQVRVNSHGTL